MMLVSFCLLFFSQQCWLGSRGLNSTVNLPQVIHVPKVHTFSRFHYLNLFSMNLFNNIGFFIFLHLILYVFFWCLIRIYYFYFFALSLLLAELIQEVVDLLSLRWWADEELIYLLLIFLSCLVTSRYHLFAVSNSSVQDWGLPRCVRTLECVLKRWPVGWFFLAALSLSENVSSWIDRVFISTWYKTWKEFLKHFWINFSFSLLY